MESSGLAKRAALTTQIYVQGIERPLTPDLATALFRISQEAFQNIYKYAAARHVILGLAFEEKTIVVTVEDDGVVFIPDAPGPGGTTGTITPNDTGGFGLLSMAARARMLGGELSCPQPSRARHRCTRHHVRATIPYVRTGTVTARDVLPDAPSEALREPPPKPSLHLAPDARLTRVLEDQPDIEVVGEAEDGLSAVEQVGMLHPDVVLLDLQLPGLSGLGALPRLRAAHPTVEVVILTVFYQDEDVFAALKAGARGYLLKDATPAAVIATVRAAARGESALAPALVTRVMDRFAVLARREVVSWLLASSAAFPRCCHICKTHVIS